jgi:hypothetical protein
MLTSVAFDGLGCLQTPGYLAPVCNMAPLPIFDDYIERLLAAFSALLLQEVENGLPYDAKTDIYGLGCLGYEMASHE